MASINNCSEKEKITYFVKDVIFNLYKEQTEDYRAIENKLIQMMIFNSALLSLFIEFIPSPKLDYFCILLYLLCFTLLFISLLLIVINLMPKEVFHINPAKVLKEYSLKKDNLEKIFKELTTEYALSYRGLEKINKTRANIIKLSSLFIMIGVFITFLYAFYFKIYGG